MSSDSVFANKVPTILITGKNGQVGWELQRALLPVGKVVSVDRNQLDLSSSESVRTFIRDIKPDIIVNAAAYTAVDKAEEEQELAYQINSVSPGIMAEEAKFIGALLIHYSTDYVFNGTKDCPYSESDEPDPLNVYGSSKLAGEKAIQGSGCDYLILRTSWVFASRGHNFLLSMLRLSQEREELKIVADQIGSPTSSKFIACATLQIICQALKERQLDEFDSGVFNLISSGKTSWHGFATAIIKSAQILLPELTIITKKIESIPTEEYPVPAKRPANSQLSTEKLQQRFAVYSPDWQEQMELSLQEVRL